MLSIKWFLFALLFCFISMNAYAGISSQDNQIFKTGSPSTTAESITITDDATINITAVDDIRIVIPGALAVKWDTTVTTATIADVVGTPVADGDIAAAATVTYSNGDRVAIIQVDVDFDNLDSILISGLKLTDLIASTGPDVLGISDDGNPGVEENDDKTITVGSPTVSSGANQTFTVGDIDTLISTITITEDAGAVTMTNANNIRIVIPSGFNMDWDVTDTAPTLGGSYGGVVIVSYPDSKTLLLDVNTDFTVGQTLTVSDLSFKSFTAISAVDNLELIVAGASGTQIDTDDKTIDIIVSGGGSGSSGTSSTTYPEKHHSSIDDRSCLVSTRSDQSLTFIFVVSIVAALTMVCFSISNRRH